MQQKCQKKNLPTDLAGDEQMNGPKGGRKKCLIYSETTYSYDPSHEHFFHKREHASNLSSWHRSRSTTEVVFSWSNGISKVNINIPKGCMHCCWFPSTVRLYRIYKHHRLCQACCNVLLVPRSVL